MSNPQNGGALLPNGDYTLSGDWVFNGDVAFNGSVTPPFSTTLASPVFTGAATGSGTLVYTNTLTSASYAPSTHYDLEYSKVTLTPASTVTAANGLNAFRGEINLTSGKTLGDGTASYVTGVYGRGNIFGTVNIGSGDLAAVYGKFDLNGSTLTSGHIAPVQSNIVNPPASAHTTGAVSLFYGESASGTPIYAGMELYMAADYFMKLTQVSGGSFFVATAPTTLAKGLKINVGGTDYWIGLYSAGS